MHQSVQDAFPAFTEPLEGRVPFMYLDVKGLVTTGVGNLIDADDPTHLFSNANLVPEAFGFDWRDRNTDAQAGQAEIQAEYTTVKNRQDLKNAPTGTKETITQLRLTDQAIDQMVATRIASNETVLKQTAEFASLDGWPADAQLGLFSMAWAMGAAFAQGGRWPNFRAAVGAQDWASAAANSKMDDAGNAGLRPRNARNALLFTIASFVVANGGDVTQLVYDASLSLEDNMRSGNFAVPLNLVIGVQTALEKLGFDPNGLDGGIGAGTRTALTNFQAANNLTQTPNAQTIADIGADTIAALGAQLDALQPPVAHVP